MSQIAKTSEIRHRERSEAISAGTMRLPRRFAPRSDEGHDLDFAGGCSL